MNTYPIYRKSLSRNTWMKILSETELLLVQLADDVLCMAMTINNDPAVMRESLSDRYAELCTRQDFEKAYGEAMYAFVKTNNIV